MTSPGSRSRIKWEGDSNQEIRTWPGEVRENIGLELHRLDNREQPLDSRSMGKSLPGVWELRDQDRDFWYRLLYWIDSGWIYVLHCFRKKTNQTSKADIDKARDRMSRIKLRKDRPSRKEEKSA